MIEYAPSKRGQPGDRLYVPMDALDQVTRYVGGENPTLDKMGGARLGQAQGPGPQGGPRDRRRADQAVRRPAGHPGPRVLARHHLAARARGRLQLRGDPRPAGRGRGGQARHGADRADGPADLRRRRLRQDRDRGPGGVQGGAGRQAGRRSWCPTTLLVQQHHATFADRYAGFPVNVAPLSRFQTDAETKATLEGLADGKVDVVVGTHRLLVAGDRRSRTSAW